MNLTRSDDSEFSVQGQGSASAASSALGLGVGGASTGLAASRPKAPACRGQATRAAAGDVPQQPWYEFLLDGESAEDKGDVTKAKARQRRAQRLKDHKQKKGTKWCRGCNKNFDVGSFRYNDPLYTLHAIGTLARQQGSLWFVCRPFSLSD